MDKLKRHAAIKQILANNTITTQLELAKELRKIGFRTTQATLSRDMKELGVVWVNSPDGARYLLNPTTEEQRLTKLISLEIESITANEVMIVVKTLPGRAQGVAEIIDQLNIPSILGTLAGDNTIFILPRSVKKIRDAIEALQHLILKAKSKV
ncbi:MAG: arginine repressor [Bacteroidetes bacterium]|nr:arginine repressor [Bacteroidota bacterium]